MELKGMYDDSLDKANHPQGTWSTNTRNIVITKDRKAISNEDGFAIYCPTYPSGAKPIGFCTLYDDEFIVFSVQSGFSDIAKIDKDGLYHKIAFDNLWNFSEDHPITCAKQYNIRGELEIVFTDDFNPPYILNIDRIPFQTGSDGYTFADASQINKVKLFPNINIPRIEVKSVNATGGAMYNGAHFFTGRYIDVNDAVTDYFPISGPVFAFDITNNYLETVGGKTLERSSNSVSLSLSAIDTRFKKIKLAVIRKVNGQYYAEEFKEITITGTTAEIVYTGLEIPTTLSLSEVIVDRPSIERVGSLLASDDILYLANVKTKAPINIQKYVNSWTVKYSRDNVKMNTIEGSHKDGKTIALKKPFMHNEVYAIIAVVSMPDGSFGGGFHIPGRAPIDINKSGSIFKENALLTKNVITDINNINVNDTSFEYLKDDYDIAPERVRYYQTRDTSTENGLLGFWENQNETYPNTEDWDIHIGGNSLRGQKVRHHKTPALKAEDINIVNGTQSSIYLKIENIYLPAEVWNQISHIEIYYVKRTPANSTLSGRGLLYFGTDTDDTINGDDSTLGNFSGGNYNFRTAVTGGNEIVARNESIRMYPFDMLVDKPGLMPTYIRNNYKIVTETFVSFMNSTQENIALSLDTTAVNKNIYSNPTENNVIRGLIKQQYFPYNTIIADDLSNRYSQESFYAKLNRKDFMGLTMIDFVRDIGVLLNNDYFVDHQTYLSDLCIWKEDCYLGLPNQEFASTGARIKNATEINVYGGDAFIGVQSYVLTGANDKMNSDEDGLNWIRYRIYNETSNNASLANNAYKVFYEGTPDNGGNDKDQPLKEFLIDYNKDYTAINTLNLISIYDFEDVHIENFPNRIMRSLKSNREEKTSSWRIFLPNDYYETNRDRGHIINLEVINGEILIQQQYGLFITRSQDTLNTDQSTIEVGTGDVFARPPKEVFDSKDGYVGSSNKFACLKGKGFYFTVDQKQGKVFIMDDSLNELSNEGMYQWFRDNLPMIDNQDNPFTKTGITTVYDEVNNRIILTKKEGSKSFTVSYSMENKSWSCFHDYIPDAMLYTANRVVSFKDGSIYLHNVKGVKGKYYTSTVYRSQIEMVVTDVLTKIASNVIWKTQATKNKVINERETLTHIMLYNNIQCSGEIPITYLKTTRNAEGIWKFNNFRDLVKDSAQRFLNNEGSLITTNIDQNKPFFKKSRFYGDYLCIRLIYDNLKQTDIVISEFGVNNRVSPR